MRGIIVLVLAMAGCGAQQRPPQDRESSAEACEDADVADAPSATEIQAVARQAQKRVAHCFEGRLNVGIAFDCNGRVESVEFDEAVEVPTRACIEAALSELEVETVPRSLRVTVPFEGNGRRSR